MRSWSMPLWLILTGFAPALHAQDPHFGFAFNLVLPTGAFRNTTYPPTAQVITTQTEGYDLGVGGQFTISIPVDPHVAIRMDIGGQATDGSNTAPGYDRINLRHQLFSLGGEVQIFPGAGSAFLHQGTYLLGGVCADFERFDRSFGDPNWDYTETSRKSRMGGVVGVGHSFGFDEAAHFTIEGIFHKTLTGNNTDAGDPPSTDFVKLSMGWVF